MEKKKRSVELFCSLFVVLIFSKTGESQCQTGFNRFIEPLACVWSSSSLVCPHLQFLALLTRMEPRNRPWTAPTPEVSAVLHEVVVVEAVTHGSDQRFRPGFAVEPVDSWRPDANVYESGEILCLASCPAPLPKPGHPAGKAEPEESIRSREKPVEGLQPVILEMGLLEDFLFFYFVGTDAVQEMRCCNRCAKMFVFFFPPEF